MNLLLRRLALWAMPCVLAGAMVAQDAKPAPDTLVFSNGNTLDGKLERGDGGGVVFKSDMAGELTVPFSKIKELHSSSNFVAIHTGPLKTAPTNTGRIDVVAGNLVVTPLNGGAPQTIKPSDLAFLIDEGVYDKEVAHSGSFFSGWNGTLTGGATLVRSTQTATTLTAGVALIRTSPTVPYLPARERTIVNLTESYGKQTSPVIPPTEPESPAVVVQTSIFHTDLEEDRYVTTRRLYMLADVAFDHNYSQGLSLQQLYGGGFGWTPIKSGKQQLDVKADVHFERQEFLPATPGSQPAPEVNLFGSTFTENYLLNLPHKMVFTENGTYLPAWTTLSAYSANVTGALAMPVFKRLSAVVSTTDNYLNDPAPYYKKNSFQFVTGITYNLH